MASPSQPIPKPPYDPELIKHVNNVERDTFPTVGDRIVEARAAAQQDMAAYIQSLRVNPDFTIEDRMIDDRIHVLVLQSTKLPKGQHLRPGIVFIHGGGMILGGPFHGIAFFSQVAETLGAVIVSVDYRLAPEHRAPAQQNDCYAVLAWVADHAEELGIDAGLLMIAGKSAGAGIAAGVALMARDRGGPKLCGQLLLYPMLDDRNTSISGKQFLDEGVLFDNNKSVFAWSCALGDRVGTEDVSIYEAPGRAKDLSGLPSTYLEAGSAEPFRDEIVAYASRLWEHGVQSDLHIWSGGFHAFEILGAEAEVSKSAVKARIEWLQRVFKLDYLGG